jgi:hypothetical protein
MNLSTQNLARARKAAVVAVAGTFSVVAVAALVLPRSIADALPVLALIAPFIAAGFLDSRIDRLSAHA